MRRARDELLGGTAELRGWIAFFDKVQVPLPGVVLADQELGLPTSKILHALMERTRTRTRTRER